MRRVSAFALAVLPWPATPAGGSPGPGDICQSGPPRAARLADVARIIDDGLLGIVPGAALPAAASGPDPGAGPAVPSAPNLFPAFNWAPPPAPAPPPVASTAPKARPGPPPMPFQVSAMWRYQGEQPVIVMRAFGNTYLLCERCGVPGHHGVGAVLEREYRIDRIAQGGITLTYLPLRQVSVVPVTPRVAAGSE